MLTAGVIGMDGRTTAVETSLRRSPRIRDVVHVHAWKGVSSDRAIRETLEAVSRHKIDFVVVGPEEPLALEIVDILQNHGVPCVGPLRALACIETSKAFTRSLMSKFNIPGNPQHRIFQDASGIADYLRELDSGFVVKPDGLTSGKGVKVSGDHLRDVAEAVAYCEELFQQNHAAVIIEERLDGEEFSLQSFCDGTTLIDMPVVQDHKRAFDGDVGPNTGGMGSYSCSDHRLPFLRAEHVREASGINRAVVQALLTETGQPYKGILYGGFMLTSQGVRLIEYNARFGDPEALNVLSILRTDFAAICEAIIGGTLHEMSIEFEALATVCKYVVPNDYPANPVRGETIDLSHVPAESDQLRIYRAAVDEREGTVFLTGSRAIAFVGIHPDLEMASEIAEEAASAVVGPVRHRRDIGTRALIDQRIRHMNFLVGSVDRTEVHA